MDNLKERALAISNKFPFSEFKTSASAVNIHEKADGKVSSCENHLDANFMELLDKGAHLDFICNQWR